MTATSEPGSDDNDDVEFDDDVDNDVDDAKISFRRRNRATGLMTTQCQLLQACRGHRIRILQARDHRALEARFPRCSEPLADTKCLQSQDDKHRRGSRIALAWTYRPPRELCSCTNTRNICATKQAHKEQVQRMPAASSATNRHGLEAPWLVANCTHRGENWPLQRPCQRRFPVPLCAGANGGQD